MTETPTCSLKCRDEPSVYRVRSRCMMRGFVVRTEGRGRRIKHLLTESGRAAVDDGHRVASGVLGKLFAPLDDGQRAVLFEALQALTADASPSVPAAEHRAD